MYACKTWYSTQQEDEKDYRVSKENIEENLWNSICIVNWKISKEEQIKTCHSCIIGRIYFIS